MPAGKHDQRGVGECKGWKYGTLSLCMSEYFSNCCPGEEFLQHVLTHPDASVFLEELAEVLSRAHVPVLSPVPFGAIRWVQAPFRVLSPALVPAPALHRVYPSDLISWLA